MKWKLVLKCECLGILIGNTINVEQIDPYYPSIYCQNIHTTYELQIQLIETSKTEYSAPYNNIYIFSNEIGRWINYIYLII